MKSTIRQRLPLMIGVLLTTIMIIFGALANFGVRQAELEAGKQKLESAALHLQGLLNSSIQNIRSRAAADAANDTLTSYFNDKNTDGPLRVLLDRWTADPQIKGVQLFDASGNLLEAATGNMKLPVPRSVAVNMPLTSPRIGNLYVVDPQVLYPVVVPVKNQGQSLGYLVRWRQLVSSQKTLKQIGGLLGNNTTIYVGNAEATVWSNLNTHVDPPVTLVSKKDNLLTFMSTSEDAVSSVDRMESTGWLICLQVPKSEFQKASEKFLYWLLLSGILLLIAGLAAARALSRQITGPVNELTSATTTIASGNYETNLLPRNRPDEIGKLARAFNAMLHEIKHSHKELKEEAEKYKLLFHENPTPMWIMAVDDYQILDVNFAAVEHYGYSREEFLQMTSLDLRPPEDETLFRNAANQRVEQGITRGGTWRHKKKDGSLIHADILATNLVYRNRDARLVVAHDITKMLEAEARLLDFQIDQQKLITQTTIAAQEKEREQIGRELHDNINQILATVKLYIELGRSNDQFLPTALDNALQNASLAIHEIRQLSKQLVPPPLSDSLPKVINDLLTELSELTNIEFVLNAEGLNEQYLDHMLRLTIYRIVQEQVNNVMKHARASRVQITMETANENFSLTITDNGRGFDTTVKPRGIGLRNIDNRVKFYNGIFRISSRPGAGAKLTVVIPLGQNKNHNPVRTAIA